MKRFIFFVTVIILSIGLLVYYIGCTEDPPIIKTSSEIEELVENAGELPEPETHPLITEPGQPYDSLITNEPWTCSTTRISAAIAPGIFPCFDPGSEIIWPGSALQGGSIGSPTPERIIVRRSSGTVLITNINGATVSNINVDEVKQSSILNGANLIIGGQPSSFPANLSLTIESVKSNEELALKLSANASFFSLFSASSNFEINNQVNVSTFLVTLNQSFYTLVFERPSTISDFFHPEVTVDDLRPFISEGNPPVYVSSVTYGRIFYLLIESVEEKDSMAASLNASFFFGGFSGNVKHVSMLRSLRVKAFAYGGDSNEALNAVVGGIQSLDNFMQSLRNGGDITTGKPLSYVIRSVRSDRLVKNAIATEYNITNCSPSDNGISITLRMENWIYIPTFKVDGIEYQFNNYLQTICIPTLNTNPDTLFLRLHGGYYLFGWKPFLVQRGKGYGFLGNNALVNLFQEEGEVQCD